MRKFYDISVPIQNDMLAWPTDPRVRIKVFKDQASGKSSNVSALEIGTHTGTHIDPPAHFISGGVTVDELPLSILIGPVRVLGLEADDGIGRDSLEQMDLEGVSRVLLKTKNSEKFRSDVFNKNFIYLTKEGAEYLVERNIRLVGIDYLSIDAYGDRQAPAHHILLANGVVILENIDLSSVGPGDYDLVCLPLRISDGDGAPARAVLVKDSLS